MIQQENDRGGGWGGDFSSSETIKQLKNKNITMELVNK